MLDTVLDHDTGAMQPARRGCQLLYRTAPCTLFSVYAVLDLLACAVPCITGNFHTGHWSLTQGLICGLNSEPWLYTCVIAAAL